MIRNTHAMSVLVFLLLFTASNATLAQEIVRPPDPPHPVSLEPADPSAKALLGLDRNSPLFNASTINQTWEGMAQTGTIRPPDPHGAAGPSGVLQTVNLRIAYYTKTGTLTWGPVSLSGAAGFWGSVGNTGTGLSDPRVMYDAASNRFYVIMQENTSTQFFLNLAVSRNSNPTTSGTADWFFYRLNCTKTRGATSYGGDYPGLGVDSQAVYVTYNMYPLPLSGSPLDAQIIILNKAAINSGTGTFDTVYTPDGSSNGFTLQPATTSGTVKPGNKAYFGEISFANTTSIRVWALSSPLSSPVLTSSTVTVPNHGGSTGVTGAPQSGTATTIPTLTPRTQGNAYWWNGQLWFCHTAGGGSGSAKAYYYKVNTNNFPSSTPTLAESGFIEGGAGVWTYQPSIGGNTLGDVCIVYTQSSSSTFPRIMFTTRAAAASSFDTLTILKASPGFSNSDRWGDYASVTADPADNSFWVTHEWAKTTALHNWSTWWGNITSIALPIQLSSFTGQVINGSNVLLEWTTLTETNNYGFEIERSQNTPEAYEAIPNSFIPGHGTTLEPQRYSYSDMTATPGRWWYRLKQIDLDGTIHYTEGVQVDIISDVAESSGPMKTSLLQNYPNPFNPITTISFALPVETRVTLELFDMLGRSVGKVLDATMQQGYHAVGVDASALASGVYMYRLRAGEFAQARKMVVNK